MVVHHLKDLGLKLQKWFFYVPTREVMEELEEEEDEEKRAAILKYSTLPLKLTFPPLTPQGNTKKKTLRRTPATIRTP